MPRVNRDLQRRMAARRERERRRPSTERRYRFAGPESDVVEPQEGAMEAEASEALEPAAARTRATREANASTVAVSARGGSRPAPRPFSAYRAEYAYVFSDLRRVAAVVGSLLVALIALYFVLPH